MLHAAQRTVLANGLTLVALPRPGSPSTTFLLAMAGGSRFDPPDRTGLAFLLSRLLDKGGGAYSSREISERIENAGAVLSTTTTRRLVTMVLTCVADAVIDLVPCVVGGARAPSLMPDEINRQRLEVRTLLAQDRSLPAVRAVEALMAALYPDPHPYGRPARGTPESLDAISRADLEAHHHRYCTPERAICVAVGGFDASELHDLVARHSDSWTHGGDLDDGMPAPAPARLDVERIPVPGAVQADLALGVVAVGRLDPRYEACVLLNVVLGEYGLGGRLGDSVRERHGLAYYAFSAFEPNEPAGPLVVRAGVDPADVARASALIEAEIARMREGDIADADLDEAKAYVIGGLPRRLETNEGLALHLLERERFGLGPHADDEFVARLRAITPREVAALARSLLADNRMASVMAGPQGEGQGR